MPTNEFPPKWWDAIRHFEPREFDSPDMPGSGHNMKQSIVEVLDRVREFVGPLSINSGFRTAAHNAKVGGKPNSAHVRGYAADVACPTSTLRFALVNAAIHVGVNRIGIAKTFVHLDTDPSLPAGVMWLY